MKPEKPFPIGTKFTIKRPKYSREYTVIDHRTTINSKGEIVQFKYETVHTFMGQDVVDYETCHTTIARALWAYQRKTNNLDATSRTAGATT